MKKLTILAALIALLAVPLPAMADGKNPVEMSVQVGYSGRYVVDSFAPVVVTVKNSGPEISGTLEMLTGLNSTERVSRDVVLPSGTEKQFVLIADAKSIYKQGDFAVQLKRGGATVATSTPSGVVSTDPDWAFCGILSDDAASLAYLKVLSLSKYTGCKWADISPTDLYEQAELLEAFDLIVVSGFDPGRLSAEQLAALKRWVTGGGTLLIGTGPGSENALTGWKDFLGGISAQGTGSAALAQFPGGEKDVSGSVPILTMGQTGWVAQASTTGSAPLLLQKGMGRGNVLVAAYDLGDGTAAAWTGSKSFWQGNLDRVMPGGSSSGKDYYYMYGSSGVLSMLQNGAGMSATFWLFVGAIAVFTALSGFIAYFLLKALGRQRLMWVAVPVLAVLFSGLLVFFGRNTLGRTPQVFAYSSTDISGGTANTETTYAFLAPSMGDYVIETPGTAMLRPVDDSSNGYNPYSPNPPTVYPVTSVLNAAKPEVRFLNVNMEGVRMAQVDSFQEQAPLKMAFEYDGKQVNCRVSNVSDKTITGVAVVIGIGNLVIGDMAPGAEKTFQMALDQTPIDQALYTVIDQMYQVNYNSPFGVTNREDREKELRGNLLRQKSGDLANTANLGTSVLGYAACFGWLEGAPAKDVRINGKQTAPRTLELLTALTPIEKGKGTQGLEMTKALPVINTALSSGMPAPSLQGSTYYPNPNTVAVMDFQIPDYDKIKVGDIWFEAAMKDNMSVKAYWSIYNWQNANWDTLTDKEQFTGDTLARYVNPQGIVRVRDDGKGDGMPYDPFFRVEGVKK